jgi:hypothetical protein
MVVAQLERVGFFVAQETVRDTQRPERTLYALTDLGRAELFDWLHELVAEPQHEYPSFGAALSLLSIIALHEAAALLGRRLAALAAEAEAIKATTSAATAKGVPWVFLVEEGYRVALLEAEQAFVVGVVASLEDPAYVEAWHKFVEGKA